MAKSSRTLPAIDDLSISHGVNVDDYAGARKYCRANINCRSLHPIEC